MKKALELKKMYKKGKVHGKEVPKALLNFFCQRDKFQGVIVPLT